MDQITQQLIAILHKQKVDFEITGSSIKVGGSLYLSGTGITHLPDNLSVGGYLDLSGTGITHLPDNLSLGGSIYFDPTKQFKSISAYKDNCGNNSRTIYVVAVGDQIKCHAGCFSGSMDEFSSRVENEYSGESAKKYIADMQTCVDELVKKMAKDAA